MKVFVACLRGFPSIGGSAGAQEEADMAKRKLSESKRKSLVEALRSKLGKMGDGPMIRVLQSVGQRFGISAQAVRYHAQAAGVTGRRGGNRRAAGGGRGVARLLWAKAREHRRLAKRLARLHERLARKYERAAAGVASLER